MAMDACLNLAILIGVLVMFNPSKFQIAEKPSITLLYCPPDEDPRNIECTIQPDNTTCPGNIVNLWTEQSSESWWTVLTMKLTIAFTSSHKSASNSWTKWPFTWQAPSLFFTLCMLAVVLQIYIAYLYGCYKTSRDRGKDGPIEAHPSHLDPVIKGPEQKLDLKQKQGQSASTKKDPNQNLELTQMTQELPAAINKEESQGLEAIEEVPQLPKPPKLKPLEEVPLKQKLERQYSRRIQRTESPRIEAGTNIPARASSSVESDVILLQRNTTGAESVQLVSVSDKVNASSATIYKDEFFLEDQILNKQGRVIASKAPWSSIELEDDDNAFTYNENTPVDWNRTKFDEENRRKPKSEKLATNADNTLTELKGSLADKMDTATLEKAQKLTKAKDEIEATAGHEKEEVYEYKDERNWKDWGTWGAWPEGMTAGKRKLRWSEEEVNVISTSD